jgi:DNA-binding transcriptional ArsR family regulator
MSTDRPTPDYELEDVRVISSPLELRAIGHRIRNQVLDLLLERAATVAEMATAIGRPKSTVAYHVEVLVAAGMLKVVSTRKVRAVEERTYGRTARIFYVGTITPEQAAQLPNLLEIAAAQSRKAHDDDKLRAIIRYNRIAPGKAREFWKRVFELAAEYDALPREGDTDYGFIAGLYPTKPRPRLPER